MIVHRLVPILNVTSFAESVAWFEALGFTKLWEWGDPPGFGGVGNGAVEVFLCQDGQGGRGRGDNAMTFGPTGDEGGDKGVWMSLFVENVDDVHRHCVAAALDVTWPPTDMPWGLREMHVRHPDGHVLRIGTGLEEE
ncbi:MAG: glyoxalase/Bleomycin resistance/Dioxygenase superfamily protein [Gemmatimonadetes bacterium]|nr:glyoxalase/Bleomycin resistance/Dioxygenase superfamily protein [Gemmatimonadota bacterium]